MTSVLDASAVLAFLLSEAGSDVVEDRLVEGAACSAVSWSEVAQTVRAGGGDWSIARALLTSYGLTVHDAVAADAEWAAERWRPGEGLSLADRFCLALGARLASEVWTANTAWGRDERVRQIR